MTAFDDGALVLVDPDAGEIGRIAVGTAPWGVAAGPDRLAYVATAEGLPSWMCRPVPWSA